MHLSDPQVLARVGTAVAEPGPTAAVPAHGDLETSRLPLAVVGGPRCARNWAPTTKKVVYGSPWGEGLSSK